MTTQQADRDMVRTRSMCSDVRTVGALDCRVRLCEGETLLGIRYVICELVMGGYGSRSMSTIFRWSGR